MKKIKEITLKDVKEIKFDGFVIEPNENICFWESGYLCYDLILLDSDEIIGRLVTHSDILHLNGIGGYGRRYGEDLGETTNDWNFDIFPNGIIRVFTFNKLILDDMLLSDFSIYQERKKRG